MLKCYKWIMRVKNVLIVTLQCATLAVVDGARKKYSPKVLSAINASDQDNNETEGEEENDKKNASLPSKNKNLCQKNNESVITILVTMDLHLLIQLVVSTTAAGINDSIETYAVFRY